MFSAPPLPRTLQAALRDLESSSNATRVGAVRDLALHAQVDRLGVIRAIERTLRDEHASVRAAAAIALADLRGAGALASLLVAVDDDDPLVQQMAISALGEIGDARATQRLRRALRDDLPEVRFQATIAFPRVCVSPHDAAEAIEHATRDPDEFVRHIAFRMAEEFVDERGHVEPLFLHCAREALVSSSDRVRLVAAILLARSGDSAGDAIVEKAGCAALRDVDAEDEATAIELCGERGLRGAERGLERRAFGTRWFGRSDRFAWQATVALAQMGHKRATRQILVGLGSWSRERRTLAVVAAGRAKLAQAKEILSSRGVHVNFADPEAVKAALEALAA